MSDFEPTSEAKPKEAIKFEPNVSKEEYLEARRLALDPLRKRNYDEAEKKAEAPYRAAEDAAYAYIDTHFQPKYSNDYYVSDLAKIHGYSGPDTIKKGYQPKPEDYLVGIQSNSDNTGYYYLDQQQVDNLPDDVKSAIEKLMNGPLDKQQLSNPDHQSGSFWGARRVDHVQQELIKQHYGLEDN